LRVKPGPTRGLSFKYLFNDHFDRLVARTLWWDILIDLRLPERYRADQRVKARSKFIYNEYSSANGFTIDTNGFEKNCKTPGINDNSIVYDERVIPYKIERNILYLSKKAVVRTKLFKFD
jgi:hypothetical protein